MPITNEIKVQPFLEGQPNKKLGPLQHFPRFKQMKSILNQVALLSTEHNVHIINLNPGKDQAAGCIHLKKLENIVQIESSFNHFLALK